MSTPAAAPALRTRPPLPPGPRGSPFVGVALAIRRDPLGYLLDAARRYGNVVHLPLGPFRGILLSDPDGIRHVLVDHHRNYPKDRGYDGLKLVLGNGLLTAEGETWLRNRRLAQPAFARERLGPFVDVMGRASVALAERWRGIAAAGEPVDVLAEMMRLTLDIVGAALFSSQVADHAEAMRDAMGTVIEFAYLYGDALVRTPLFLPTPSNLRFRRALRAIDRVVERIVDERRARVEAGGPPGDDLLGLLMAARDDEGRPLSPRQLRDESVTMLLAGHETTANGLAWAWHYLDGNPEVADRLREEADAVLGGRAAPSIEDLPRLEYGARVVQEVLRLRPPAWALGRVALADDVIAGYRVPRRTMVFIFPWVLHRHPAWWEDPERFDPDRFTVEKVRARPRFAWMPFNVGPRQCIGNQFALLEIQAVLTVLARRYRPAAVPGGPVELEPLITLRPRGGLPMVLREI